MTETTVDTMQALVLDGPGRVHLESREVPDAPAGRALVRVAYCGVCGSDLPRLFEKGAHRHPLICGHEFSGVVDSCGTGVTRVAPGQRVVAFPLLWCGRCEACETGDFAQCADYDYLGSRSDGGFAEFVTVPETHLLPVPPEVNLAAAALTEPAAVALHAVTRAGQTLAGRTVAVFGAGPIGLLAAQWARALGAAAVLVIDVRRDALRLAGELKLRETIDASREDAVAAVNRLSGGRGADVCIEAAGVPPTMQAALRTCARAGTVVLLGNPSADVTLPAALISQVMRREVRIAGTWNSSYSATGRPDDWRTTLRAMAEGTLNVEPLITHRVPLSDAIPTLRAMHRRELPCCKVLIEGSGERMEDSGVKVRQA
jgi:L-iditol 2-dehydrogenase